VNYNPAIALQSSSSLRMRECLRINGGSESFVETPEDFPNMRNRDWTQFHDK